MNLRQRMDEIRQLEQKATPTNKSGDWVVYSMDDFVFADAMRNAIGPLLEVVEQQHRALAQVLDSWECEQMLADSDTGAIRAALSLMDKEES